MFMSYGRVVSDETGMRVQFTGAQRSNVASAVVPDKLADQAAKCGDREVVCYSEEQNGAQVAVVLMPR